MTKTAALTVVQAATNDAELPLQDRQNMSDTSAVIVAIGSRAEARQSPLDQTLGKSQPRCNRRTCPAMEHGCALFPSGCVSIYKEHHET